MTLEVWFHDQDPAKAPELWGRFMLVGDKVAVSDLSSHMETQLYDGRTDSTVTPDDGAAFMEQLPRAYATSSAVEVREVDSPNNDKLEAAIQLLSDPNPDPDELEAAFADIMDTDDPDLVEAFRQAVMTLASQGEGGKKRAQRAMEGRVAVEREVHRASGKTHKQIYWVRQEDVRSSDKPVSHEQGGLAYSATAPESGKPGKKDGRWGDQPLAHFNGMTQGQVTNLRWKIRLAMKAGKTPDDAHLAKFGVKNVAELNALFKQHGVAPLPLPGEAVKPPPAPKEKEPPKEPKPKPDPVKPPEPVKPLSEKEKALKAWLEGGQLAKPDPPKEGSQIGPGTLLDKLSPADRKVADEVVKKHEAMAHEMSFPKIAPVPAPEFKGALLKFVARKDGKTSWADLNQESLKQLGSQITAFNTGGTAGGISKISQEALLPGLNGQYNLVTHQIDIKPEVSNSLETLLHHKESLSGTNSAAVVLVHEMFHAASNKNSAYEGGAFGAKAVPGTVMEEATTELLAQHYTADVVRNSFGVEPQHAFTKPLFEAGPYGLRATRPVAYEPYVVGFARAVAYVDNLKIGNLKSVPERGEITAAQASAHIAGRALQLKNLSDQQGVHYYAKVPGPKGGAIINHPPNPDNHAEQQRYGALVRPLLDKHGIGPDHPNVATVSAILRNVLGDFMQGRGKFAEKKSWDVDKKETTVPAQRTEHLDEVVRRVVKGGAY